MNALNILSGLSSTPPATPARSRTSSATNIHEHRHSRDGEQSIASVLDVGSLSEKLAIGKSEGKNEEEQGHGGGSHAPVDEKTPLMQQESAEGFEAESSPSSWRIPKRIASALTGCLKLLLGAIIAPAHYMVACFYDEQGNFSAVRPIRKLDWLFSRRRKESTTQPHGPRVGVLGEEDHKQKPKLRPKDESNGDVKQEESRERSASVDSTVPASSDSETEKASSAGADDSPSRNTRSRAAAAKSQDEIAPARKSIRIKLHSEEALKKQRRERLRQKDNNGHSVDEDRVAAVANSLKSPSSPAASTKLKYPRTPAPPRPLVPRRQPSYSLSYSIEPPKKTLIIDLDETLIHSMAKGGRMSTGHMVEVKFQGPIGGNGVVLGPQVPILYYVHERPHCHEFLRKICKWYNLIVFTASVQEYADPVIDWLERERKYFSGRYYRQHCTFRNGAYIKDLSQVEPDLSKVMILDNSPMSYIFHEDNAIPIEGWISDPTDNDLLHLVPFLEGLQYATDVRALLALRLGQHE